MSHPDPIDSSDEPAGRLGEPPTTRPDWLVGADEGTLAEQSRTPGPVRPGVPPRPPDPPARVIEPEPPGEASSPSPPDPPSGEPVAAVGPVAWKAAASSVPRLRQQPAAPPESSASEPFQWFAQDAMMAKAGSAGGSRGTQAAADLPDTDPDEETMPLGEDPPFWAEWLDRLRMLPRPVLIGVGSALVLGVVAYLLWPRGTAGVSLAQIRQHPEAFEGRSVRVGGKAGETFAVGGSYVYNLFQGRDTVVVYSRLRRPRLHERVKVEGTVSIGYLEGEPRVAVLEDPPSP